MRKTFVICILLGLPLFADDRSKQTLSATYSDRFPVSAAGTIRIENAYGEVTIDGWDRPGVEVTAVRSTEGVYGGMHAEAQRRLDSVQVTAKQQGNDVVISTVYPARNGFAHPLARRSDIEISYTIHAPRASRLIVDDRRGGVDISDMSGDIRAAAINGQLTLTLAPTGHYAIHAQTTVGDIYSDFGGHDQRRQIVGKEFGSVATQPVQNLDLRVRIGDIVINKLHGSPTD